jgi:hypothetical protein
MDHDQDKHQSDPDIQIVDIPTEEIDSAQNSEMPPFARLNLFPFMRQRQQQLIVTISLVLLTLLILVGSVSGLGNTVIGMIRHSIPTPTPTLGPGADLFYVQADPPWGQLSIDGHNIAHLPAINRDAPLHFSAGHHVLQWKAAPFITQHCLLSVPPDFSIDTCADNNAVPLQNGLSAYVVTFSVSLVTLPARQQTLLVRAAQNALNSHQSSAIVRPGELYASLVSCNQAQTIKALGQFAACIKTASQPLKATLSFQLDTNMLVDQPCASVEPQPICSFSGHSCHEFCSYGDAGSTWDVGAAVSALWTFTTLNGQVVTRNVPDDSSEEDVIPLHVTWNAAGWRVSPQLNNSSVASSSYPSCQPVASNLNQLGTNGYVLNNPQATIQWSFFDDAAPADGCLALAQPISGFTVTPTPTTSFSHTAYILFRFGVILAANQLAQQYFSYLPLADGYEQRLAMGMVTHEQSLAMGMVAHE